MDYMLLSIFDNNWQKNAGIAAQWHEPATRCHCWAGFDAGCAVNRVPVAAPVVIVRAASDLLLI